MTKRLTLNCIIKAPLAIVRVPLCIGSVHLFVYLSVCLFVFPKMHTQKRDYLNNKGFRAMVY